MSTTLRPIAAATLLLVLTSVAYLPAMRGAFLWDDNAYVTGNPNLRSLAGLYRIWLEPGAVPQYYPVVFTSFWIEWHLWGNQPLGYHLVNVLLHSAVAIGLWRVLRRLGVPAAWFIAAIFALHPVHVESVAWITERKNVLSGLFYIAAIRAYLCFSGPGTDEPTERRWGSYWAALALFLCALLSKTVTCSLPAVLLLLGWWKERRFSRREVVPLIPFFAAGIVLGLVTVWLEHDHVGARGPQFDWTMAERCLIAGRAVWFYAAKIFWPSPLTFIYPKWSIDSHDPRQYVWPIGVILMLLLLWASRRRIGRGPLVAALFFVGTLLPALGFFDFYPMRFSFVADHFQYLASIGPIVLLGAAVLSLVERYPEASDGRKKVSGRLLWLVVAGIVLASLGTLTFRQARIYRNQETLWRDTLAKNPDSAIAHNNLGRILWGQGKRAAAARHYQTAIRNDPSLYEAANNLGIARLAHGDVEGAIARFEAVLRIEPRYVPARINLARALRIKGDPEGALSHYEQAVGLDPRSTAVRIGLAEILGELGKTEEAHRHLGRAIVTDGSAPEPWVAMGVFFSDRQDLDEAERYFRQALRIDPDHARAHGNLGAMLMARHDYQQAVRHLLISLARDPSSSETHNNLGVLYEETGELTRAVGHYRESMRLDPRNAQAHRNLAIAATKLGDIQLAIRHHREAMRLRPGLSRSARDLAWILSTHPDPRVRNGPEALELARSAYEATGRTDARALETLAAAYAETGRFAEAVQASRTAIVRSEETGDQPLAAAIRERLKLYETGLPYRRAPQNGKMTPREPDSAKE